MKEVLISINNELQQIWVRGIDAVHMANALKGVSDLINILSAESSDGIMKREEQNND